LTLSAGAPKYFYLIRRKLNYFYAVRDTYAKPLKPGSKTGRGLLEID